MAIQTLKGKVAVIGAGAKNLGGLISRTFGADGASVVVHYNSDSTKASADETVQAVKAAGGDAFAIQGDLTRVSEVVRLFDEAIKRYGGVDIAVNTVGKVLKKPFIETTEEEYDSMFAINSKAAYFFIQEAGKRMNDGGKIITILTSLLAAFTGLYSTYAGSKSPVEHFTRAAAKEFGPRGISVNNVAPGPMDTPFFYPAETPETIAYHKSQSMNGELTKIEDIVPIK
jgi:NAD(P)-dependent dehydrogenase (short-subunit alcohol dehydrogenase family)